MLIDIELVWIGLPRTHEVAELMRLVADAEKHAAFALDFFLCLFSLLAGVLKVIADDLLFVMVCVRVCRSV